MTVSALRTRLGRLLWTGASAALINIPAIPGAIAQQDASGEVTVAVADANSSTIVYGPKFFANYPNAVSVLDLIRRIPSGEQIMNSGGNGSSRGFSGNDDKILINGKRMSGKSNDSESALERISVDQVERIEIIRGSSPDIKVSSQEGVINIIVKAGAENGGGGSWRADVELGGGTELGVGGFASYGDTLGKLEYFASVERTSAPRKIFQNELALDGIGDPQEMLDEIIGRKNTAHKFSGNVTYTLSDITQVRLNGLFALNNQSQATSGQSFDISGGGAPGFIGDSARMFDSDNSEFELGGDFETRFNENTKFKLLALYRRESNDFSQGEDLLIENGTPEEDILFISTQKPTEMIGRTSLSWTINSDHELEFGTEMAINKLNSSLDFFLRESGALVPQDIAAANTTIKESRNESFVIHSWKMNDKMTLDSQVFTEYSKISQTGEDIDRARSFFFIKPTVDFRWNLTKADQLQVSLRRRVRQLRFGDFASSPSDDDKVVGGNTELVPEKYWESSVSLEHRLANDGGRIKLLVRYQDYQDRIELIEVSPGISGRGNVGPASRFNVVLEGSIRMAAIGLPNLIVEPRFSWNRTRIRDPFTEELRGFSGWNVYWTRLVVRHDLPDIGLTYGLQYDHNAKWREHDIDEFIDSPSQDAIDVYVEKTLFGGMTARMDIFNVSDRDTGRDRHLFDDLVAGGVETSREIRERRFGRIYKLSIKGTF